MPPSAPLAALSFGTGRGAPRRSNGRLGPAGGYARPARSRSPCNAAEMRCIVARGVGSGRGGAERRPWTATNQGQNHNHSLRRPRGCFVLGLDVALCSVGLRRVRPGNHAKYRIARSPLGSRRACPWKKNERLAWLRNPLGGRQIEADRRILRAGRDAVEAWPAESRTAKPPRAVGRRRRRGGIARTPPGGSASAPARQRTRRPCGSDARSRQNALLSCRVNSSGGNSVSRNCGATAPRTACSPGVPSLRSNSYMS
jgi:hypothetical protein